MKKRKNKKLNQQQLITLLIIFVIIAILSYFIEKPDYKTNDTKNYNNISNDITYSSLENIPDYNNEIRIKINDNKPYFNEDDYTTEAFEHYSELDILGRCGVAYANICKETMPKTGDKRGNISNIHPTGWKQTKFNGEYLYNRCHLIAHSLTDEDANEKNLITGTRYFNVQGMLPIEMQVNEYMDKNKNNHVLYRVTPIYKDTNLLTTGVEMEAYSVEDNGKLSFNVFVYNVQPGANIDYKTGELIKN